MAAKTWETDFRFPAICESISRIGDEHADELFSFPDSFCVPVAEKPIVGWTPGRIFLMTLVLGFASLGAGVLVMNKAEEAAKAGKRVNAITVSAGLCLVVAGMASFFAPVMLDRLIMKLLLGSRGAALGGRPGDLLCAEISDADRTKMKIAIDGSDYVLLLADYANERLLIEGVSARYMIRAKDVIDLRSFEFMNYVGTELTFRIGDKASLSIAIARVSILLELTRQAPVLGFLRKLIKSRIHQACSAALRAGNEYQHA